MSNFAQIVSPPFACGVAWLINALLELDIKVTNAGFNPGHWIDTDSGSQLSAKALKHLMWHLPALHQRQLFKFPESLEVEWEHRLDFASGEPRPTILFVRDPRDAVYSLYRRNYEKDRSFISYLNRPDVWPDHFPNLFQLPPLETYSYFVWFWKAMSKAMPVKIIRFEDAKSDPIKVVNEVLSFLGIDRTPEKILSSIESSSTEKARKAMLVMEAESGQDFKTVRKGIPGEWRESYSLLAQHRVGEMTHLLNSQLGYGNSTKKGFPLLEDSKDLLNKNIPVFLRQTVANLISATEDGHPPTSIEVARLVYTRQLGLSDENLLKLGAIIQAIYYVNNIFKNTAIPQAKIALHAFVNLNLFFWEQWPIEVTAWLALRRVQEESRIQVLDKLAPAIQNRLCSLFRQ